MITEKPVTIFPITAYIYSGISYESIALHVP
jgi:hypothetical protein